jgi:Pyridoxamine 5'-phosphate oxidase
MTLDNAGWSLLDRGGRLETLDRDECRRLLGSANMGRLGYCSDSGPRILPMNYTLVGESVTFRTGLDTRHLTSCSIIRLRLRSIKSMSSFSQGGACWS